MIYGKGFESCGASFSSDKLESEVNYMGDQLCLHYWPQVKPEHGGLGELLGWPYGSPYSIYVVIFHFWETGALSLPVPSAQDDRWLCLGPLALFVFPTDGFICI